MSPSSKNDILVFFKIIIKGYVFSILNLLQQFNTKTTAPSKKEGQERSYLRFLCSKVYAYINLKALSHF